jgi:hypothetical protein
VIRGSFEAHLTVEAETVERRDAFAAACAELGVKCVLIELARGAHRSQPMTSSHHAGTLDEVLHEVEVLRTRLVAAGFAVSRVKVEAEVTNEGVPVDEPGPPGSYFEFHAKLATGDDIEALRAICLAKGAHLSNNAIQRGLRFVTMRAYEVGRTEARARFERLLAALSPYELVGTKAEFTVHDSRLELDAGWLP